MEWDSGSPRAVSLIVFLALVSIRYEIHGDTSDNPGKDNEGPENVIIHGATPSSTVHHPTTAHQGILPKGAVLTARTDRLRQAGATPVTPSFIGFSPLTAPSIMGQFAWCASRPARIAEQVKCNGNKNVGQPEQEDQEQSQG